MQEESKKNVRERKREDKLRKDSSDISGNEEEETQKIEKLSEEELMRRATIMWKIILCKKDLLYIVLI